MQACGDVHPSLIHSGKSDESLPGVGVGERWCKAKGVLRGGKFY